MIDEGVGGHLDGLSSCTAGCWAGWLRRGRCACLGQVGARRTACGVVGGRLCEAHAQQQHIWPLPHQPSCIRCDACVIYYCKCAACAIGTSCGRRPIRWLGPQRTNRSHTHMSPDAAGLASNCMQAIAAAGHPLLGQQELHHHQRTATIAGMGHPASDATLAPPGPPPALPSLPRAPGSAPACPAPAPASASVCTAPRSTSCCR